MADVDQFAGPFAQDVDAEQFPRFIVEDQLEQSGVVADDLAAALAAYPTATAYFDAFPRSAKRGILEWISTAKTPQTRAKRIEETARLAAENQRANQWRK